MGKIDDGDDWIEMTDERDTAYAPTGDESAVESERIARAPWQSDPETVADVAELVRRFNAPELCVEEVLCAEHPRESPAFVLADPVGSIRVLTYGELNDRSRRLAALLQERGVGPGVRVAVLMTRREELPVTLLAIWRLGGVHVPLFTAFARPAIEFRVTDANVKLIVTEEGQRAKVDGLGPDIIEVGRALDELIAGATPLQARFVGGGEAPIVQLYTSGTTGTPKAVIVPARAIAAFIAYMRYGLDVRDDDVFWNAADPGWAYGLYYGIIGPLAIGSANVLLATGFSVETTVLTMARAGVTNLAAAPTVYRSLKAAGVGPGVSLRRASSAGEPLTPDVVEWAPDALGCHVRDHYGQTEHGMVICNSWRDGLRQDVRAGSMGQALPGFVAGTIGSQIVLSVHQSPLMWFAGYENAPEKTRERYSVDGAWYLTGDVGREDDGDFFFAARDDDVILAAGYRIGPFDIESILVRHEDVAEAAVVGRPDEIRGEVVEAFIVLESGAAGTSELCMELQELVRENYGAHAYPRRIHFVEVLPKTPSGKVQRFLLRSPEFDMTTASSPTIPQRQR